MPITANLKNVHNRHNAAQILQRMSKNTSRELTALEKKLNRQLKEFQKSLKESQQQK